MGLFRKSKKPLDTSNLPPLRVFSITQFPKDEKAQIIVARKNKAKDGTSVDVPVIVKRSPIKDHPNALGVFYGAIRVGFLYEAEREPVVAMLDNKQPVHGVLEIWIGGHHHTVARPHLRLHV